YGYRCSELDDPRVLEQTPNTTIETQEVLLSRIAERVAARYGVNEFDKESLISFIKSYILDNYSIDTLEVIGPFGLDETHSYMTYIKTVDGGSWNKKHQMACIKRKSNYRTIFVESKNFDL
ncbi:MAG: hypothetical protein KDD45_11990, partial [Bdellovibrionales bacterium]|nr:hypothetical protein [Bdellovibrionales bacterium]